MTTYIYARVSTDDQNVEQQAEYLGKKYPHDYTVSERFTGTTLDRPKFEQLTRKLKPNDTLIVKEVSRLGRSTTEILALCESLRERNVRLVVDNLNMDVTSPTGKLVFTLMVGIAEMEREQMLERQRIGINRAQAEGKYKGRKSLDASIITAAKQLLAAGATKKAVSKQFNIGESTLYKYLALDCKTPKSEC
ncbi:recombinase family protein [Pseudomonas mohnii]